jgi:phosphotransferase system enzyme I (PtsP)
LLEDLRKIVQSVNAASSFQVALDTIVNRVKTTMGTEVCSIYIVNRETGKSHFVANEGLNPEAVGSLEFGIDEGLVGLVVERAELINLDDATGHPRFQYLEEIGEEAFHAFLGVPIIHHRRVLGVLIVQQREIRKFDDDEEAFLVTLSAQLAGVVAHAEATGNIKALAEHVSERGDKRFVGVPGAPGIAIGTAVVMHPSVTIESVPDMEAENIAVELMVFDRAIRQVRYDIERVGKKLGSTLPPEERALFDAYLHMLDDAAIADEIRLRIQGGQWAQGALKQVILEHASGFEQMEDSYLSERASDVRELGQRVMAYLQDIRHHKIDFPPDTILVGDEVTAAMLGDIPVGRLKGIVSVKGSGSSHVAILARALDVPAVMGALDVPLFGIENRTLIVDGFYGQVVANPTRPVISHYASLMEEEREFTEELEELRDLPCVTRDGKRVLLWVNIGLVGDISRSLDRGAEGIGLFRTEVPFMTEDRFPTEEEQREIYREHMVAFDPNPVTMRTLDIGGDKALSYFPISEENPFLGWRGIRVTLDHPEIFMGQVRAMIKANAGLEGDLRIMLPFVTNLSEVHEAVALIDRAHREVIEEGYDVKKPMTGVMIEVPAAVYQARQIAKQVDFLAVGSNDLTQYMLAVDRNNPAVAGLYRESHPAVLRALREVAKAAHAEGKPVGICGELAGTPEGAVVCVGMGYDVLSMNATNLLKIKWVIRQVSLRDCRRIVSRVLRMLDADEIHNFIRTELINTGLNRAFPRHEVPNVQ